MLKKKYLLSLIAIPLLIIYLLGLFLCFNAEKVNQSNMFISEMSEIEEDMENYSDIYYRNDRKKQNLSKFAVIADMINKSGMYPNKILLTDENFNPVLFTQPFIKFIDGRNNERYCFFEEYADENTKAELFELAQGDDLRGEKYFYYFEGEDETITPVALVYRTPDKKQIGEVRFMDYDQQSEENKQFGTFLTVDGKTAKKIYSPVNFFSLEYFNFSGGKYVDKLLEKTQQYYDNYIIPCLTDEKELETDFMDLISNREAELYVTGEFMLNDGKIYHLVLGSVCDPNIFVLNDSYNFRQQAVTLTIVFAALLVMLAAAVEYLDKKQKIKESKYTFANAAAHELKTPLSVIQNQCECIMEKVNESNNDAYVSSIYEEAMRMNRLVKNLLQYNSLAVNDKLKKEKVNLSLAVSSEVEKYKALLDSKDLTIIKDIESDCYVNCNDELISLVIDNYLSNAVKFAEEGSDIVAALKKDNGKIVFTVFNKGEQINRKKDKELWTLLYSGDESRQGNSSGMGLALSAQILDLHKFKYGYKNRDNGVEFYFVAK